MNAATLGGVALLCDGGLAGSLQSEGIANLVIGA
jgi:hypothetical protein